MLHVEERELVVPGQTIAEGDYRLGDGVFREGDKIIAGRVGLMDKRGNEVKTISLEGRYVPKTKDKILGIVTDDYYAGWILDINAPYEGNLSASSFTEKDIDPNEEDLREYLDAGDVVEAKVQEVDELMNVRLEVTDNERGKVTGGRLVEISPSKIPRVIGRKGSMISVLQKGGKCSLSVGQNGRIVVWGGDKGLINKVVEAILMIEREAHTSGLTDRVKEFLEKE